MTQLSLQYNVIDTKMHKQQSKFCVYEKLKERSDF